MGEGLVGGGVFLRDLRREVEGFGGWAFALVVDGFRAVVLVVLDVEGLGCESEEAARLADARECSLGVTFLSLTDFGGSLAFGRRPSSTRVFWYFSSAAFLASALSLHKSGGHRGSCRQKKGLLSNSLRSSASCCLSSLARYSSCWLIRRWA